MGQIRVVHHIWDDLNITIIDPYGNTGYQANIPANTPVTFYPCPPEWEFAIVAYGVHGHAWVHCGHVRPDTGTYVIGPSPIPPLPAASAGKGDAGGLATAYRSHQG